MIINTDKLTEKQKKVVADCTFPTQKETSLHYQFVFTDNRSLWRVFKPYFNSEQQESIVRLLGGLC